MFGALLGALKGVGSGLKHVGQFAMKGLQTDGEFDKQKLGKTIGGFGQGAQAVDPNSAMGAFGSAYGRGVQRQAGRAGSSGGPGTIPDSAYGEGGVLPSDIPAPSVIPDSEWQPTDQPMGMTPTQGPNPDNQASMSALERLRYGQYGKYGTY